MTTNVVAPPTIANVGRSCCKLGLKVQTVPGDDSITGKADLVALGSWAAKSGEYQRALRPTATIEEERRCVPCPSPPLGCRMTHSPPWLVDTATAPIHQRVLPPPISTPTPFLRIRKTGPMIMLVSGRWMRNRGSRARRWALVGPSGGSRAQKTLSSRHVSPYCILCALRAAY